MNDLKPCPFCHNPKLDHMFVELKNDGYEFYCLKVWCHIDEKDGQAVGCDAYFEFTNPTKAGTVLSFNDRTDKPRPWLRAEEVREPGKYHHASHNEYYGVILIVFVDTEVWVRALGDYGPDLIGDVAGDDSRFQRIPEPELPKEGES